MTFKYFKYPKRFGVFISGKHHCSICNWKGKCMDATLFYGEEMLDAICPKCLKAGKLKERQIFTNDGDTETLLDQLVALYPAATNEEIVAMARARTDELETQTPAILSWQDWKYPAIDGDYGQFIGLASQQDLNELAPNGDGKTFLQQILYRHFRVTETLDHLWENIPPKPFKDIEDSNRDILVYLFKSLTSDKYVAVWDTH